MASPLPGPARQRGRIQRPATGGLATVQDDREPGIAVPKGSPPLPDCRARSGVRGGRRASRAASPTGRTSPHRRCADPLRVHRRREEVSC